MAHVASSGGAGFIGSNLVAALAEKGHSISVVDDLSTGLASNIDPSICDFYEISLVDHEPLASALLKAEVIFILAQEAPCRVHLRARLRRMM